jgi:hypothetical protein
VTLLEFLEVSTRNCSALTRPIKKFVKSWLVKCDPVKQFPCKITSHGEPVFLLLGIETGWGIFDMPGQIFKEVPAFDDANPVANVKDKCITHLDPPKELAVSSARFSAVSLPARNPARTPGSDRAWLEGHSRN